MRVARARPSDVRKSTSSWTESVPLANALGSTVRSSPETPPEGIESGSLSRCSGLSPMRQVEGEGRQSVDQCNDEEDTSKTPVSSF